MRYADPTKCPRCRGNIGGVAQCPTCGYDLASSGARELWDLFVQADTILDRSAADTRSAVTQAAVTHAPTSVSALASPQTVGAPPPVGAATLGSHSGATMAPAPLAPRMNVTPGAVLLGLGALSLVVAATIFVSLTWGSLGIVARAGILLAITALFGVGLWAGLRRKLAATSEALAFIVLAMVTVNVSAATYEGMFGLDQVHWGYPVLIWAGLVIVLSYVIQTFSDTSIDRNLFTVEAILGFSTFPAAIAAASFVFEFWPDFGQWALVAGVPILVLLAAFTHQSGQRIAWWTSVSISAFWVFLMTAWVWVEVADTFEEFSFVVNGPVLVFVVLGVALGFVVPKVKSLAWTYAVANGAFFAGTALIYILERRFDVEGIALALYFFALFAALHLVATLVITATKTILRWIIPVQIVALLVVWTEPVGEFLFDHQFAARLAPASVTQTEVLSAIALIFATVTLVGFGYLVSRDTAIRDTATRSGLGRQVSFRAFAVLVGSFGLATALWQLNVPIVVLSAILLLGVVGLVWISREVPIWQFVAVVPALFPLLLVKTGTWSHIVVLVLITAVAAGCAWWIDAHDQDSNDDARYSAASMFAALGSWTAIAAAWYLPSTAGSDLGKPYIYLAILVAGVIIMSLVLANHLFIRLGGVAGAALHALAALVATVDRPQEFALVAVVLAAACVVVALADRHRRAYLLGAFLLGAAAWVAQLSAWDVEVVEAYTAPIAAILLILGVLAMRHYSSLGSVLALSGGLALGFIPSVSGVATEPASLRALLFGVAALLVLVAGIYLRWLGPVIAGALALGFVILANIGPIILDMDRWILFGVIGAVLLAVGIRWEHNVLSGKALIARLALMK